MELTVKFNSTLHQQTTKGRRFLVGTLYTPHTLSYNERLVLNGEVISQKIIYFTRRRNYFYKYQQYLSHIARNTYTSCTLLFC